MVTAAHGVPDRARGGADPHLVARSQCLEVVEGTPAGVHGVSGDERPAVRSTGDDPALPPAQRVRVARRGEDAARCSDRVDRGHDAQPGHDEPRRPPRMGRAFGTGRLRLGTGGFDAHLRLREVRRSGDLRDRRHRRACPAATHQQHPGHQAGGTGEHDEAEHGEPPQGATAVLGVLLRRRRHRHGGGPARRCNRPRRGASAPRPTGSAPAGSGCPGPRRPGLRRPRAVPLRCSARC